MIHTLQIGTLIEPELVKFTFNAPGWYIVAALFLLCLITIGVLIIFHYRKNRYRREALNYIESTQQYLIAGKNYMELLYTVNILMKKITISQHGRKTTASLQGKSWIDFLNSQCSKAIFDNKQDENILAHLYLDKNQVNEEETLAFVDKAKQWIKHHRYVAIYRQ